MTDNSTIHNEKLTIRRKNKHLLNNLKYVSRRVNITTEIDKLPDNLEIGSYLNIVSCCPYLDLKNLKVHNYIIFSANDIHKIYPTVEAKDYYVSIGRGQMLRFKNVYEIYDVLPHLVPDESEFQSKYGFDHIQLKDGAKYVPVVLGSINSKDMPILFKSKLILVYSADKKFLDLIGGDEYKHELYYKIYDELPDMED